MGPRINDDCSNLLPFAEDSGGILRIFAATAVYLIVPPLALRVLFVEDSPDDVALIKRELARHGFDVQSEAVETRTDFVRALDAGQWDIILSDHSMAGFNSGEALSLLRHRDSDVPFIIVSGTIGEDAAVEAMRAGAHDYVLKHNLRRLGAAVERELREAANRRMQRSTQQALHASELRLQHAQRMESVGRLAAGIAHDFNNLLTVIMGFTEFLLERLPAQDQPHQDAMEIRSAAQRAARLTKQLLAFSRQQVVERKVVDLVGAVTSLQPMINRLIGEDLQCEFSLAAPPQWVLIDPGQFEQVLMNLVVNARDAMPAGGKLRVSIAPEHVDLLRASDLNLSEGPYVVLTVADTGHGIDKHTLDCIFEPFFTTKAPGEGTGLGLSTVFGIVRQGAGAIDVESQLGEGATFRVYFPLSDPPSQEAAPEPAPATARTHAATILLAEDEQGVRSFLEMVLIRAGHKVVATRSGPDALDAGLRAHGTLDLFISDVVMPGLSGPEVADQLRRKHPTLQTLFLSGYARHTALPEHVSADPRAFLQKPFTIETFMDKVRERLSRA
jgi:two-component system, cell cycle sensor histidine kinase and response regulator CckA